MKLSFLVDQNLSSKTVDFIRKLGHEAKRVDEVGLQGAPDRQIADFAKVNNLIILTLDKDFGQIYFLYGKTHGVILVRPHKPTVENVNALLKSLLDNVEHAKLRQALTIFDDSSYRIIKPQST